MSSRSGLREERGSSVGRVYEAWLGGKDTYRDDRALAEEIEQLAPGARAAARAARRYLDQSVCRLAGLGIDQFLDLGCGIAQEDGNVHDLARSVLPGARVVYVDIDPVIVAIARANLEQPGGPGVSALAGDVREPGAILDGVQERRALGLDRPVAVLLASVLHFVTDEERPAQIVRDLAARLAPGSCLMISHIVADDDDLGALTRSAASVYTAKIDRAPTVRTTPEIAAFFEGLELLEPPAQQEWEGRRVPVLAGIGRVPLA